MAVQQTARSFSGGRPPCSQRRISAVASQHGKTVIGDAKKLISFKFDQILDAYATFGSAADTHALKVLIEF